MPKELTVIQHFWNNYIKTSLTLESLDDITFTFNFCPILMLQKFKLNIIQQCFNLAISENSLLLLYLMTQKISEQQAIDLSQKSKTQAINFLKQYPHIKETKEIINLIPEEMKEFTNPKQLRAQ